MAHEFKSMVGRDGLSAVDVESPHLSLCCQGHDRLDNLCNCEDGAISPWNGGGVGHEEVDENDSVSTFADSGDALSKTSELLGVEFAP